MFQNQVDQTTDNRAPVLADIRAHQRVPQLRTHKFSSAVLLFSWTTFILLHVLCFLYYGMVAWCYWNLPGTRLAQWLSMLYIGLDTAYDQTIAVIHAGVAIIHLLYLFWMVGWSLRKKSFVFAVYNVFNYSLISSSEGDNYPLLLPIKDSAYWFYQAIFTRDGFFGVDGPNFDLVLLCREIVETAFQTYQGYRMSVLLPRRTLNRGYIALLVLNCWSTAFVHNIFEKNVPRRRLLTLVSDCMLDLVSSVGLSIALVAIYIPDFDFRTYGFPLYKWYEDFWRVHVMSEFQMILVASWEDLAMRILFAMSMLGNMNNMKKLMRARPTRIVRADNMNRHRATTVAPFRGTFSNLKKAMPRFGGAHYWMGKITELGFFVWGLAILIFHLHAESKPELPQCKMQVKPWTASLPSCSLLELNCYESGLNGSKLEIEAQWTGFDPTTVVRIVIRHCPAFEMPVIFTSFSELKELKIYNSTIINWDATAAITNSYHPMLTTLFLIRVNMTNGELPLGLQATDFPLALDDIEFCVTNLRSLPDDLDLKWPQYASIYLEASEFDEVPPSLVRLAPYDLSLSMNPISTLPRELFESDSVAYLSFGGTLISELPQEVDKLSSSLFDINLSDTNISFFWVWIDPLIMEPADTPPISAANTPFCWELQRIFEGRQDEFSTPALGNANESILLNASEANWPTLYSAVSCWAQDSTWYPLKDEDEYSKLN